ncbi:hypothetical protein MSG28_013847 [Choristoneura fumiferana]|uniref:Uncharacterized protein n=1 Tax=Choristoneura fumiferana TaxID=7141 RepID=A0ACC0K9A5_CHOFU|nr:hypothetical protein MSG28_013847 [Choristoneura fumiferana]
MLFTGDVFRIGNMRRWSLFMPPKLPSIPFFTQGIESTTLTSTAHAGHFTSQNHVPWSTTTYILAAMASAPIFCYVIERFGRKVGIFIISLVQGTPATPGGLQMHCQPRGLRWDTSSASNFTGCLTLHAETQQCKPCCFTAGLASKMVVAIRADLAQGGKRANVSPDGKRLPSPMDTCNTRRVTNLLYTPSVRHQRNQHIVLHTLAGITTGGLYTVFPTYIREISSTSTRGVPNSADSIFKCLPPEHPTVLDNVTKLKEESDRARAKGNLHLVTILKNPMA